MNFAAESADHQRKATSWAAATLALAGATLHPIKTGWDVEFADGSWAAANNWRELCVVASAPRSA